MLVQPRPEAPVLDLAFANGHFHLRDANGVFRSANGLDWEWASADTVFQDTKVGDLWFRVVDEGGAFDGIYASVDGAHWRGAAEVCRPGRGLGGNAYRLHIHSCSGVPCRTTVTSWASMQHGGTGEWHSPWGWLAIR